jgi:heme exporter protein A
LQAANFSGLSVRDIDVWRGEKQVLAGVALEVAAADCVHVLGPNGSGKTTLLRVIAGLLPPERGRIEWNGGDAHADRDAWCASMAYLAHSDGVKPEMTAHENLAFDAGLRRSLRPEEIETALRDVVLSAVRNQPAATLSAGQRRRLAFARVVLAGAPLWILDEPYTNLDRDGTVLVAAIIGRHLDAGGAALIAAHQPPAIPGHRPRVVELAA